MIDVHKYIDEVNAEIATIQSKVEVLKEQVKSIDPIRKELQALDERQYHLLSILGNLQHIKPVAPEVQAALNPADPFGLDAD